MNDIARTTMGQGAQARVVAALARALGTAPSAATTELPAEAVDALLRRVARGEPLRRQALLALQGPDLDRALSEAVARLGETERARIGRAMEANSPKALEDALAALAGSAGVRHTLLTFACGRLLEQRPLDPGARVADRYEVIELVGVGGMGVVYKATDLTNGTAVAVKLLRSELARDPACVRRFAESSRIGQSLAHEGVVRVVESGVAGKTPFLAMEWVEGPTLRACLDLRVSFTWEDAQPIVHRLLGALAHAHALGVLHLDVKPENVLLPTDASAMLCDFDLARVQGFPGGLSLLAGAGTPDYMAPEQRRGGLLDARTDVFSAGVLVYELLSGRLPGRYTPMLHLGFGAPIQVSRAVEAALHDEPARRPADAAAFLEALEMPAPPGEPQAPHAIRKTAAQRPDLGGLQAIGLSFVGLNPRGFYECRNGKDGSVLIYLPSSSFLMGGAGQENEGPVHGVNLGSHLIGKYPVTNAQFRAFCEATGHPPPRQPDDGWGCPAYFENAHFEDHPVVGVTWSDAAEYCEWAGLRLPSEAEWEHAARWVEGGTDRCTYPWGDQLPTSKLATFGRQEDGGAYTSPVRACPDGASPCGAMDMAGNVWEWCADYYSDRYYRDCSAGVTDPEGPPRGRDRVLRGGAWCSTPRFLRVTFRDGDVPGKTYNAVGFRVARTFP